MASGDAYGQKFALESVTEAEEYLKKHRIAELFNDLCAGVCFKKPDDVRAHLVQELQKRADNPSKASMLFEPAEIDAVFRMSDLMQIGTISASQAKQALSSIVNTQAQYDMAQKMEFESDRVDLNTFRKKVQDLFG